MTPVNTLRAELLELLQITGVSAVSCDAMQAAEIEKAIIVSALDLNYQGRQLDMVYYRELTATLTLVAKTTADLDEIVDALALVDNQDTAHLRDITIRSVGYKTDTSDDLKIATAALEMGVSDY